MVKTLTNEVFARVYVGLLAQRGSLAVTVLSLTQTAELNAVTNSHLLNY